MHDERRDDDGDVVHTKSGPSAALIAFVVLGVVAIIFVLQNSEKKDLEFLFVDVELPVWVALVIAIAVGVVLDRLLQYWMRRRRRNDA